MANELVTQEAKYKDVSKAMLGRIVVVDTVDHALKIAKKFDYGIRMVTLEGELPDPGGSISGGNFKNNLSLLSRRREMDELKALVEKTENEVKDCEKAIEDCKARNQKRLDIERMKLEYQESYLRLNTARIKVNQAKEKMGDVTRDFDALRKEAADIRAEIADIEKEKVTIDEKLKENLSLETAENEKVKKNQAVLEEFRKDETEKLNVVSAFDVDVEKLLQKQGFHRQNLDRVLEELSGINGEKVELCENFDSSEIDIQSKMENIEEIKKTIEASHTTQSETESSTERDKISGLINGLDKELFRLNSQKEKMEESLSYQTSYMWNEYEITLNDAKDLRDER